MFTKQEMDAWDEHIRQRLVAKKKELGMSDAELGEKAFKDVAKVPKSKVQYVLTGQGSGEARKPQNLRAADLMNLCEALRMSWYDEMEDARKAIKEKI